MRLTGEYNKRVRNGHQILIAMSAVCYREVEVTQIVLILQSFCTKQQIARPPLPFLYTFVMYIFLDRIADRMSPTGQYRANLSRFDFKPEVGVQHYMGYKGLILYSSLLVEMINLLFK